MNQAPYISLRAFVARLIIAILILIALVGIFSSPLMDVQAQAATFRNPLNNSGADPWMFYYNGNYYLITTTYPVDALRMRRAPTIAALKTASLTTIASNFPADRCCNVWAPEIHQLSGPNGTRWYLYYSSGPSGTCCDGQRVHVLESAGSDPMGPYTYKAKMVDGNNYWGIDGTILKIGSSLYFVYSGVDQLGGEQNTYIAPMSNPWTISGNRVRISTPSLSWERQGSPVQEGPEALYRNGQTFIVYSASSCGTPDYKLGQLTYTGTNPLSASSWTKKSTPIFQRNDAAGVYGPGHNSFFTSPDGTESWIAYHANSSASQGCGSSRTTRIQKFTWNADGSPNLGSPLSTSVDITVPSGEGGVNPTFTPTRTPTRTNTPNGPTLTPTRTPTPGGVTNLALGRTATTDSAQSANPVANGNDGNTSTRWCAANGNAGHWWKVDLGSARNLTGSEVMWEFARNYRYRVEVSTDNTNWTTVVDKTNSTSTAQTQNDPFTANARYVRITVTGLTASPTTWASFFEFRVFGN